MRINRDEMIRAIHDDRTYSDFIVHFLLGRRIKTHADLIDQLFSPSERRLARALLAMAQFGKPSASERLILPISQDALAETIGTTRSQVSFFMNRF